MFNLMTKTRAFLFAALALIVVLGLSGQQALAQDNADSNVHVFLMDRGGPIPDAGTAVLAGPVQMVAPPPSAGPPPSWPCFAPNAPCSADPAGGMLIGLPIQQWPISGSTNCTMVPCGQVMAMFTTTTGSGSIGASVSIAQGSTVIYSKKFSAGTAAANQIGVVSVTGIQFAPTAVAGAATVTVQIQVGSNKVGGRAVIYLM
jgi:hypothetical protein